MGFFFGIWVRSAGVFQTRRLLEGRALKDLMNIHRRSREALQPISYESEV